MDCINPIFVVPKCFGLSPSSNWILTVEMVRITALHIILHYHLKVWYSSLTLFPLQEMCAPLYKYPLPPKKWALLTRRNRLPLGDSDNLGTAIHYVTMASLIHVFVKVIKWHSLKYKYGEPMRDLVQGKIQDKLQLNGWLRLSWMRRMGEKCHSSTIMRGSKNKRIYPIPPWNSGIL